MGIIDGPLSVGDVASKMANEHLVMHERAAVAGLAEMLNIWCKEAGMRGALKSLVETVSQADKLAKEQEHENNGDMAASRIAIMTLLTAMHQQRTNPALTGALAELGQKINASKGKGKAARAEIGSDEWDAALHDIIN